MLSSKSQPDVLGLTFNKPSSPNWKNCLLLKSEISALKDSVSSLKSTNAKMSEIIDEYSNRENKDLQKEENVESLCEQLRSKDTYIESLKSTIEDLKKPILTSKISNSEVKDPPPHLKPLRYPHISTSTKNRTSSPHAHSKERYPLGQNFIPHPLKILFPLSSAS